MRVIEDVRAARETFANPVLTIGSFDGVHLGHQRIVEELRRAAREIDGTAALMTLHPHPRQFFCPETAPNILTPLKKKTALLEALGLDVLFVLPFTAEVADLAPEAFVEEVIVGKCRARMLVVGHDFAFGKGARGDYEFLQAIAPRYGFEVRQVPAIVIQGERVGSTGIRERILQGEVDKVEPLLGRRYAIGGEVVRGRGIGGARLGFPTANVKPHSNAVPAHGVYAGEVILEDKRLPAAVNIGIAPTILQEDVTIEAYILDFHENIVGREIEVEFHKRLRPEKKFSSLDELIHAIERDVEAVRTYFGRSV
ncbi:MAG TPA: bifunctional riboflavin kinase/FAD synthetase [Candidatus Hydrogenedentes bacterium]|nr:bifunctional riboflavin kinase/FAD synthetase [Candidatus Hydrogenedentota bacterium]